MESTCLLYFANHKTPDSPLASPNSLISIITKGRGHEHDNFDDHGHEWDGMGIVLWSEVYKPYEILIKTLNALEYIESDVQNIAAPRPDDPII